MYSLKALILFMLTLLWLQLTGADLLDCNEDPKVSGLTDLSDIGPKVGVALSGKDQESSSGEHKVRDFFKNVGCYIKKGVTKMKEGAKKLGIEIKEDAKKLSAKAKDLGSDIKDRFLDIKEKLSKDSVEELTMDHSLFANVEIINPDILKSEQQCGHGHILDALGNCSKLRK